MKEDFPEFREMKSMMEDQVKEYVPDRKTLREKAEEVNFQSTYKDAYKRLSEYVHSSYKSRRDFDKVSPYTTYMKRLVFSDVLLVTLEALRHVCERFDLDGGIMVIDDPGYKGAVFYSTNPKKEEGYIRRKKND